MNNLGHFSCNYDIIEALKQVRGYLIDAQFFYASEVLDITPSGHRYCLAVFRDGAVLMGKNVEVNSDLECAFNH